MTSRQVYFYSIQPHKFVMFYRLIEAHLGRGIELTLERSFLGKTVDALLVVTVVALHM